MYPEEEDDKRRSCRETEIFNSRQAYLETAVKRKLVVLSWEYLILKVKEPPQLREVEVDEMG